MFDYSSVYKGFQMASSWWISGAYLGHVCAQICIYQLLYYLVIRYYVHHHSFAALLSKRCSFCAVLKAIPVPSAVTALLWIRWKISISWYALFILMLLTIGILYVIHIVLYKRKRSEEFDYQSLKSVGGRKYSVSPVQRSAQKNTLWSLWSLVT